MRGSGWRVKFLIGDQKFRPGRQWPAAENASLEACKALFSRHARGPGYKAKAVCRAVGLWPFGTLTRSVITNWVFRYVTSYCNTSYTIAFKGLKCLLFYLSRLLSTLCRLYSTVFSTAKPISGVDVSCRQMKQHTTTNRLQCFIHERRQTRWKDRMQVAAPTANVQKPTRRFRILSIRVERQLRVETATIRLLCRTSR